MSNGIENVKAQATQGLTSATMPVVEPALGKILSHVIDNNSRLQDTLVNVQAFNTRTLGEDVLAHPGTEVQQPQGMLGNIEDALSQQTVLISELQEAVRVLERIG